MEMIGLARSSVRSGGPRTRQVCPCSVSLARIFFLLCECTSGSNLLLQRLSVYVAQDAVGGLPYGRSHLSASSRSGRQATCPLVSGAPQSLDRPQIRLELVEVHVECCEREDVPRNLEVL